MAVVVERTGWNHRPRETWASPEPTLAYDFGNASAADDRLNFNQLLHFFRRVYNRFR